jgi:hypothetical protein
MGNSFIIDFILKLYMFISPSLFLDDRTEDGLSFLRVERINTISSSERMNYGFDTSRERLDSTTIPFKIKYID